MTPAEGPVHCECGVWTGERCAWSGPADETVLVAWVAPPMRGTYIAAGEIRSDLRIYATKVRAHEECAHLLLSLEPRWAELVTAEAEDEKHRPATPARGPSGPRPGRRMSGGRMCIPLAEKGSGAWST